LTEVRIAFPKSLRLFDHTILTLFFKLKALAKEDKAPLAYTHFKAEGDVEFKAILFIPEIAPSDMFDNYYNKASALKLYVRRVFISDEFDEVRIFPITTHRLPNRPDYRLP
jgi:heat shock protein beta